MRHKLAVAALTALLLFLAVLEGAIGGAFALFTLSGRGPDGRRARWWP